MEIFNSVDEISEVVKQWGFDIEYLQTTKKPYQGSLSTCVFDDSFFVKETITNQVTVNGKIEDNYYILMFSSSSLSLNGSLNSQNELLLFPPGSDLTGSTHNNSSTLLQVGIPKSLAEKKLNNLSKQEVRINQSSMLRQQINPDLYKNLNSSIYSLCTNAETNHALAEDIQTTLIDHLIYANDELCNPSKKSRGRPTSDHNLKFKQAIDYINNNLTNQITLDNLCLHTSSSLKNLTRIFAKHSTLTPARYITTKKLHAIYYDLLKASIHETTVSQVAHKYHINHMGRLAANYYSFFKEYPSQTLMRK